MEPLPECRTARPGAGPTLPERFAWRGLLIVLALWASVAGGIAFADEDARAEDRRQLHALMDEVEAGINAQSVDRLAAVMADDVTVTWLNAEVSRGTNEVKAYYSRMVGGEGAILKKYTTRISLGAPARFHGDVAIAEGKAEDSFFPHARGPFTLDSRWSSTLRKVDGQWKIAALHLSANVFTNPLMAEAERWIWLSGAGGLALGALALFLLTRLRRR